ncbi:hypothetical protein [Methylosinus sp. Sm6]|uniref:DUF6928 family protein n=1 Tax=Methylosinus sp. Sm6 TaxID=2866948 RepID=UPI001C9A05B9|nr:hypothetical protein [Methylosinus sp. Sm6]MBY6240625.1 hypothetical protein [Methylosinus sp. Sm6]
MGWKCDALLIRPASVEEGAENLLRDLGFRLSAPIGDEAFLQAIWPMENTIWVGRAGDCLLLSSRGLADPFFGDDRSDFKHALFERFPGAEIAAVLAHSVSGAWAFAVYRKGECVRRKGGSSDDGTIFDVGAPLVEEAELLARSRLDAQGRRMYRLPGFPDEEVSESDVGEELVFKIIERMTGARPDVVKEGGFDLLELPCVGFALRPWWKFW